MLFAHLAELVQLNVHGRPYTSAKVAGTGADVAETLTPCERMTLLLHRILNLHRQTDENDPSSSSDPQADHTLTAN